MVKAITQFEASDGTIFSTEKEAIQYEKTCDFESMRNSLLKALRHLDNYIDKNKISDENLSESNQTLDILNNMIKRVEHAISMALYHVSHNLPTSVRNKQYVIDQMLRILAGDRYNDIIKEFYFENGYVWDVGVDPFE